MFLSKLINKKNSYKVELKEQSRVFCVVGMHRSGTSCLTGSLQKAGLYLGKHQTWNLHNQQGNRENPDVVELHEDILKSNGGAWNDPPKKIVWTEAHFNKGKQLILENTNNGDWGFKDPRSLLVLEGWKKMVGDIQLVGIIRHPNAVANSLKARGKGIGVTREKAFELWMHYNKILLQEFNKKRFPILSFDWDEETFHVKFNQLSTMLGLKKIDGKARFYSSELMHHRPNNDNLPQKVMDFYRKLINACL